MSNKDWIYMVGDFETTVYEGQKDTKVWASGLCELYNHDNINILHSIDDTLRYLTDLESNIVCYYHNLKFDGSFWLDMFIRSNVWKQAYDNKNEEWYKNKDMHSLTYKYSISSKGQWYTFTFKTRYGYIVELRDSVKLLPFSLATIGKAFNTEHQKLTMEYKGERYPGCNITPNEKEYLMNDLLVLAEALEIMFDDGHNKLTIGSCAMHEYRSLWGKEFKREFPKLSELECSIDGFSTVDEYIRKSYNGGWVYAVPGKTRELLHNGVTADANSLYPSVMHSKSGNYYPIGEPIFWIHKPPKSLQYQMETAHMYSFVRIKCKFHLKDGKLPFIHIKGNLLYDQTEVQESTDVMIDGEWVESFTMDGDEYDTSVILTLTQTDYILLHEQYDVEEEVLDGCTFPAEKYIFDDYIDKYMQIKENSKGAKRTEAKLFLNNLYGKFGTSPDASFKFAYLDGEKIKFTTVVKDEPRKAVHIAIASAITSYARDTTIRIAQANYYGTDKPGFAYADTDSIHCDGITENELVNVPIHKTKLCHWKIETRWDDGWFVRAKTYIEHVVIEDGEEVEPYHLIKCAGLPTRCKNLLADNFDGKTDSEIEGGNKFLEKKRNYKDFDYGIKIPGKLLPKRIPGGILLVDTTFEMR